MSTPFYQRPFSKILILAVALQLPLASSSTAAPLTAREKIMKIDDIIRALDAHRIRLENLESHPNALSELRANLEGESPYETNDYSGAKLQKIIADTKKKVLLNPKDRVYRTYAIVAGVTAAGALLSVQKYKNTPANLREECAYIAPGVLAVLVAGFYLNYHAEDLSFESAKKAVLKELADRRSDFLTLRAAIVAESTAQKKAQARLRDMTSEGDGLQVLPVHIE